MNFDKYPLAKKFMDQHPGMTIEQAKKYISKQLETDYNAKF